MTTWKIDSTQSTAYICTAHPGVAVLFRTIRCPLCEFLGELEDLEARAKQQDDAIAELKLIVEELRAAVHGKPQ